MLFENSSPSLKSQETSGAGVELGWIIYIAEGQDIPVLCCDTIGSTADIGPGFLPT